MRILNRYVGVSLLSTALIAVLVLTFVLLSGNLFRAFELLARGLPPLALAKFLLYLIPVMLTYTLPLAMLVAAVMVFGRLSAENELSAMRASGIGLWQIITPGLLLAALFSGICLYLQMELGPRSQYWADQLRRVEAVRNPLLALEPGRWVELPGHVVYVGNRNGSDIDDVHIYVFGSDGRVAQDIYARRGKVLLLEEQQRLQLQLQQATIVSSDSGAADNPERLQRLAGQNLTFELDYGNRFERRPLSRRTKHMTVGMIFGNLYLFNDRGMDPTPLHVELYSRMALALAPLAFLLVGVPCGIQARRAETSVGIVVSLVLALVFYVFLIMADSLKHQPQYRPEILVWLPNIGYQLAGIIALHRKATT